MVLEEVAPGVRAGAVQAHTGVPVRIPADLREMPVPAEIHRIPIQAS